MDQEGRRVGDGNIKMREQVALQDACISSISDSHSVSPSLALLRVTRRRWLGLGRLRARRTRLRVRAEDLLHDAVQVGEHCPRVIEEALTEAGCIAREIISHT